MTYKVDTQDFINKNTEKSFNGGIIKDSGIYKCVIERAEFTSNKKGAKQIRLFVTPEGMSSSYIFGPRLEKDDKTEHYEKRLFDSLILCCGLTGLNSPVKETVTFKSGKIQDVNVFKDLSGKEVYIRVQLEVTRYNNQVQEKLHLRNFFRASDKASAIEIITGSEAGKRFETENKIADKIIFSNNTTQEDLDELRNSWKENQSAGSILRVQSSNVSTLDVDDDDNLPF